MMALPRGSLVCLSLVLGGCNGASAGSSSESGSESESEGSDSADSSDPAVCTAISSPVQSGPGAQLLEEVAERAQIPGLAAQPTAHGQTLSSLHAFDGRLHLGYGDYNQNTGPISMPVWDPELEAFLDFGVLPGEEVRAFFAAHGSLYAPAIDPDGHQEFGGVYRLDCGAQDWTVETPIEGAVHVYGLAAQGETLYATSGSLTGAPARLVASVDHGHTWTELLDRASAPTSFSRFYSLGATPELLFVAGREHGGSDEHFAWVRHGQGEFELLAPPPVGTLAPIVLGETLVITNFSASPGFGPYLGSYAIEGQGFAPIEPWPVVDGASELLAWTYAPGPDDALEDPPAALLVLMSADPGRVSVQRSEDLGAGPDAFVELANFALPEDEVFVSMALLRNDLYFGARSGALWALRELELPA